jgi:hypothetical protein
MKMTAVVGILFFGLALHSKADESTIDQIKNIPGKVADRLNLEVAKTKEFQKIQFHNGKDQIVDLAYQVKGAGESLNINQVSEAVTNYFSFMVPKVKETPGHLWVLYEDKYNSLKDESHYTVKGWKEQARDYWLDLQGKKEEKLAEVKEFFNSF